MDYQKPRKGDPLSIPADLWAAIVDLVAQSKTAPLTSKGVHAAKQKNSGVIRIKNTSGEDCERYTALMIDEPLISPDDNEDEFKRAIVPKGILPTDEADGRWVVLQEPLADDAIGEAVVVGITQCKIFLNDQEDKFVEVEADNPIPVSSADGGSAQILWVAGGIGTADSAGEQLAIIKIGGGSASLPKGTYQHQVYQMVTDNKADWGFVRFHPQN